MFLFKIMVSPQTYMNSLQVLCGVHPRPPKLCKLPMEKIFKIELIHIYFAPFELKTSSHIVCLYTTAIRPSMGCPQARAKSLLVYLWSMFIWQTSLKSFMDLTVILFPLSSSLGEYRLSNINHFLVSTTPMSNPSLEYSSFR